jgi:hypothetical protein
MTRSDSLPGVTRFYRSFSAAAQEANLSRILGGIHWSFDHYEGLATGKALGQYVVRSYLVPVQVAAPAPGTVLDRSYYPWR